MSQIDPNNEIKKKKKLQAEVPIDPPQPHEQKPEAQKVERQFDNQYKIMSVLLIMFAVLLFFALVSYTTKDEVNAQITLKQLFELAFGNEELEAKAATTHNWLGIFGAFLSDFLINGTIGYAVYLFPIIIIIWSRYLFTGAKIPKGTIRRTYIFLILSIIFSTATASMQKLAMFADFEKELSGAIGQYLSWLLVSTTGMSGTLILMLTATIITVVVGFNLDMSVFWKRMSQLWNSLFESANEAYSSFKDDIKTQKEEKTQEKAEKAKIETVEQKVDQVISNEIPENPKYEKVEHKSDDVVVGYGSDNDATLNRPVINIVRKPLIRNVDDAVVGTGLDMERSVNHPIEPVQISDEKTTEIQIKQEEKIIPEPEIIPEPKPIIKNEPKIEEKHSKVTINPIVKTQTATQTAIKEESINKPILASEPLSIDVSKITPADNTEYLPKSIVKEEVKPQIAKTEPFEKPALTVSINKTIVKSSDPANVLGTYIHDEEIEYQTPGKNLLNQNIKEMLISDDELKTNAQILQEKLETFKIYIENLQITPGPVVTQYEFVPAAGIKISKIESLADDLAMALKAKGIRIIAPIPGKGTVGIEIPNAYPSMVLFSEVVNSQAFAKTNAILPLALGKTISGEIYILDMTKMPHLLIAGSTGAGKSVGINTIIASLLYKMHPSELKFVIIDPKKVELQQYAMLRDHFLAVSPDIQDWIITKPEDAVAILKSAVVEMEQRYTILAKAGQRNILDYNKKVDDGKYANDKEMIHRKLPYIVVIIDELADLMLTASKDIEEPITRLAQMARAVGIHLIVATQRPSVDVITGLIKANFPARIAYLVASKIDSRTILDMQGAEQLLGQGDMLCLPAGKPKPERVQNAFINTDEVENICEFIGKQQGYAEPYYLPSLNATSAERKDLDPDDRDPLFEDAAKIVIMQQQASASMLQRRLRVGYARAGRLIDELQAYGVIGPFNGSNARLVLMESEADLERIL